MDSPRKDGGKPRRGRPSSSGGRSTGGRSGRKPPPRKGAKSGTGGAGRSRSGGGDGRRNDGRRGGERRSQARSGDQHRRDGGPQQRKRRDVRGAGADLPKWLVEDIERTTPAAKAAATIEAFAEASAAFAEGRYRTAARRAAAAKDLSPRNAPVRELLGLAAYRAGQWKQALAELRTYRRMTGNTGHLPVEMDTLRALGRTNDVPKVWEELQRRGAPRHAMAEGKVVYGSFLADQGRLEEAWEIVEPGPLRDQAPEAERRVWYVAARVAALRGDTATARRLRDALLRADPAFPGMDELESTISGSDR